MDRHRERYLAAGFIGVLVAMVLVAWSDVTTGTVGFVGFFGVMALLVVASTTRPPRRRRRDGRDPRDVLERRLAKGEISCEEYFERDAILRSAPLELPRTRDLSRR